MEDHSSVLNIKLFLIIYLDCSWQYSPL